MAPLTSPPSQTPPCRFPAAGSLGRAPIVAQNADARKRQRVAKEEEFDLEGLPLFASSCRDSREHCSIVFRLGRNRLRMVVSINLFALAQKTEQLPGKLFCESGPKRRARRKY
jgi:hypothetical protein